MWANWFSQKQDVLGFTPLNQAGGTMLGKLTLLPSTIVNAGFNIGPGVAPTTPVNGDMWLTPSGLYFQVGGATIGPITATVGVGCAAMPALTGAITSPGGSCVTTLAAGQAASNLGAYVSGFNTRTGAVTPQTGDYTVAQETTVISGTPPAAGTLGEVIAGSGSVTPAAATATDLTSISVTAGSWACSGNVVATAGSGDTMSAVVGWISTTSATPPTIPNGGADFEISGVAVTAGNNAGGPVGVKIYDFSASTTTVYLTGEYTLTAGTNGSPLKGAINCVRKG
jgi:hypothetical protein